MNIIIERMDHLGNGIGYLNEKIIFVPKTVTNDEVKIIKYEERKNFCKAIEYEVIKSSETRVEAFCPYYDKCGGCHLQNLSYVDTLEYKGKRVANILSKIDYDKGIDIIPNEDDKYYRNKIELKIIDGQIGFYEKESHKLITIEKCMITRDCINSFFEELKKMNIQNGDVMIRCNYNDELLICINTQDDITLNTEKYPEYKVVGIILNNTCIYGEDHFLEKIHDTFFEVSYDAFFQVNNYINEKLFELIMKNVEGNTVLDLYSGVGTLSIMAAKKAKKVYGIEIVPNAVVNALKNAKINNANNIKFILGNVEDKIKLIEDDIDTVIVDPPRKGLDNFTIQKILEISPSKIIYISCETQKLAEDLKSFIDDYEIANISVLDMFSYTYHAECVCVLNKK